MPKARCIRSRRLSEKERCALKLAFRPSTLMAAAALGMALSIGCNATSNAPSPAAVVTFAVANETFRVALTTSDQVAAARAAQAGGAREFQSGASSLARRSTPGGAGISKTSHSQKPRSSCVTDGLQTSSGWALNSAAESFCPWSATIVSD